MANKFFPTNVHTGDKIVVCNTNACVIHTRTDSNGWLGGAAATRTISSNGGGSGSGGGGGSSGGVNLPGGCIGHCNGTVTVGGR
jgi:hypothetical protein